MSWLLLLGEDQVLWDRQEPRGPQGFPGYPGPQGETGAAGPQGATGQQVPRARQAKQEQSVLREQ